MSADTNELLHGQVFRDDDQFHVERKFAPLFQGGPLVFWVFAFPSLLFTLILPNVLPAFFGHLAGYADLLALPMSLLILPSYSRKAIYPVAKPIVEGGLDYNNRKPGMSGGYEKAGGIAWIGTVRRGKQWGMPVFLTNAMLRAHAFLLGTTGAGKTQTILGFLWSFLVMGSGFTLVDGKGDIVTWHMICAMAWLAGREDDLLLVNYTTGDVTLWDKPIERQSITINLMASGSLNTVSGLIKSLLGKAPEGDNKIWHERTVSFIEAILTPLVYMRDHHNFQLSTNTLREYITLPAVKDLRHKKLKIDGRERTFPDIPDRAIDPIRTYLNNLPGYKDTPPPDYANDPANVQAVQQMPQVPGSEEENKQHGFVTMQLIRALNSMSDSFGHIFGTQYSELDWDDVALNRRIVVTILPSLEKPPSDLEILGKIIVAGNKMMLARLLGNQISKGVDEPVDVRVTDADHPYSLTYDEKASYMVEGEEDILAQGRSLGMSVLEGSQDLPRLTEKSKLGAAAIDSCTGFKGFMKLQDEKSIEFAVKSIGKAWMKRIQYYKISSGMLPSRYADKSDIVERVDRVNAEELPAQKSGQMFLTFEGKYLSIASAYFPWPKLPEWRISHGAILHLEQIYGDQKTAETVPAPLDSVTQEPYPGDPPSVPADKVLMPDPKDRPIVTAMDQKSLLELTETIFRQFQAVRASSDTQQNAEAESMEWSARE